MDTKEAGRKGGLTTAKRGKAYYQTIGRKGGKKKKTFPTQSPTVTAVRRTRVDGQ